MRRLSRLLRGIVAACLAVPAAVAWPGPSAAQQVDDGRGVPFLTLRNRTGATTPDAFYGDERSDLKAGRCTIRELDLDVFAPMVEAVPSYLREELLRVAAVRELPVASVLDALQESAAGRVPVLYTHGYFIGFEKGCRRATLLQENAGLSGRLLWFSWPSDGALINYTHDEADLYWSVPDLADVIVGMHDRFGPAGFDLAGHSLGARGIVLALYEVANRRPDIRVREVVLIAPDMDFAIFERILPRIRPVADNITVYVASGDRPLALSAQLHGYPRLGQSGNDVGTLPEVDVIDLGELPGDGPTGHLYHIHSRAVGQDLNQLLAGGLRPGDRRNLTRRGPNLWQLQPEPPRAAD